MLWLFGNSQVAIGILLLSSICSTTTNAFQPSLIHIGPVMSKTSRPTNVDTHVSGFSNQHANTISTFSNLKSSLASSSSSSSSSTDQFGGQRRKRRQLSKDVVIIGGGLAGLSAALYLSQIDPDRHITILDKENIDITNAQNAVSSFAAAGMLAPNSERLPKGKYLDLCLESKRMYPDFCDLVESLAKEAGEEGSPYLPKKSSSSDDGLEPWNIGYIGAGGFLAPAFAGDNVATWAPPETSKGNAQWLDSYQVRELEPNLHPDVVGGWWFPEDASVDARRLTCSLRAACVGMGVQYLSGSGYEVSSLDLSEGDCKGLWLKNGKYFATKSILVANGAWMRNLLPVPLEPHKGQSLSLRMPKGRPPLLRRVLFAQDSYIVPKADGRIVIGATVEAGSFDPNVTPAGIMHILSYALELVPGLKDLPLEETWAGLRPTTPDKGPILGETPWKNLFLAGGYWRNGVLLAPKTGELLASLIAGVPMSDQDRAFLKEFAWDRFTSPGKGTALAANARYAASMYPVHNRKSGVGIAASVGTELGSYSTAVSAKEERAKDRDALFNSEDDEFERAASLGKEDGTVFSFKDKDDDKDKTVSEATEQPKESAESTNSTWPNLLKSSSTMGETVPYGGSADALTVAYSEDEINGKSDLESTYANIKKNKAKQSVDLDDTAPEDRPDPGFRIYHIENETGIHREVPPYTSPGEFLESIKKESPDKEKNEKPVEEDEEEEEEVTFDGYTTIQKAAALDDNIRETMRQARMKNRFEETAIDYDFGPKIDPARQNEASSEEQRSDSNLSDVYKQIRDQKSATTTEWEDSDPEERPDPGFRIYHIEKETGIHREVPPYTSPGEFLDGIQKEGKADFETTSTGTEKDETSNAEKNDSAKPEEYNEKTFDGYQDIIAENSNESRDSVLEKMREARRKNRLDADI